MSLRFHSKPALATAALCVVVAHASAAAGPPSVDVHFREPAHFTDVDRDAVPRQAWLDDFAAHLQRRAAAVVPTGERLLVTVTDIRRAGTLRPGPLGSFHDIRIVRDETSPRVDLTFQLVTADGQVLKEGQRSLHDIDFLFNTRFHAADSSEYEQILVDDWLHREFGTPTP